MDLSIYYKLIPFDTLNIFLGYLHSKAFDKLYLYYNLYSNYNLLHISSFHIHIFVWKQNEVTVHCPSFKLQVFHM